MNSALMIHRLARRDEATDAGKAALANFMEHFPAMEVSLPFQLTKVELMQFAGSGTVAHWSDCSAVLAWYRDRPGVS
jgi:hypothetical protein